MKQHIFEKNYQAKWKQLSEILEKKSHDNVELVPSLYRQACHDLSLAKRRRYTPDLIEYLNQLVMNGHQRLYSRHARRGLQWLRFIVYGFPQVLRRNSGFVYVSLFLFLLPGLVAGILCYQNPELIYSAMPPHQVSGMESMYDPNASEDARERESDSDILMFGFYIKNNIGIGFRTFAGGIFFCLGSLFFIIYNGIILGGVSGHLTQLGFTQTFYPFVIGHGAFELTAIVFSGAAGLKMGFSLISPGPYKRSLAIRESAKDAILIMTGAALMLVIAAFIEAFWSSSSTIPDTIKYTVGAICWLLVIVYCIFSGRKTGQMF